MPRGGMKVKPAKVAQVETSAMSKLMRTNTNNELKNMKPKMGFLSRSSTSLTGSVPEEASASTSSLTMSSRNASQTTLPDLAINSLPISIAIQSDKEVEQASMGKSLISELELPIRPTPNRTISEQSVGVDSAYGSAVDSTEDLTIDETESSAASVFSRDSTSIYSRDSTYSNDSASIYSSGASIYSIEEDGPSGLQGLERLQYQQRARAAQLKRQMEPQDAASRERSSLARKAAMFKNSKLQPELPTFSTTLPKWSMVCRAIQASADCYDSAAKTRRGTYTAADTKADIKAMIVDDQLIDESRLVIVAIRGTQMQSLSDWSVNLGANPASPAGFLDDEENMCHEGFMKVTKAMLSQVAAQLEQHPASSEKPRLLFTGHSAGGAVAAMLYSHMLSKTVTSDLTVLADKFPSINCVTFGAPPLSLTPLPNPEHGNGIFLSFANEGDPVSRLSDAAYIKTLWKLMTASAPSAVTVAAPPQVKVVRRSRGNGVVRATTIERGPATPWEELPLWPTPPAPLANGGEVVLLRDDKTGTGVASKVTVEDLKDAIFADLAAHTSEMYMRRVKDVAFAAMIGRNLL